MRRLMLLAAALVVSPIDTLSARPQGPFDMFTDPGDRALLPEMSKVFGAAEPDLAALDALLKKLPRPTRLRAIVQTARSAQLADADRTREAIDAVEEAMRILPGEAFPKLTAVPIMTFGGAPQRAADLWIAASIQSPEFARQSSDYVLSTLQDRLHAIGDRARADRLMARIGEIGLSVSDVSMRSNAALAGVRAKIVAGDADAARGLISGVVSPSDLRSLYIDRRYESLWPAIDAWAGKGFEQQERIYLEQLRSEWQAAHAFNAGTAYVRGLRRVGAYQAAVDIFLDHLSPKQLTGDVEDVEYLAAALNGAMIALGRGEEAITMLSRVKTLLPDQQGTRALNLVAAMAEAQLNLGRASEAAETAKAWRVRVNEIGAEVNGDAIVNMARFRACALIEAGRADEAAPEIAEVLLARSALPSMALRLYACQNDHAGARAVLLERLQEESTRGWALNALQPATERGVTPHQKKIDEFNRQLRADPVLRAAAEKVGRILPELYGQGLPRGFMPSEPAQRAPQSPDNI